jgi:hypothetical protein
MIAKAAMALGQTMIIKNMRDPAGTLRATAAPPAGQDSNTFPRCHSPHHSGIALRE